MVEWLAGNRIRGTSAEKPVLGVSGGGGWKEIGRTALGSANATIDVTSLADKRYLMMLCTSTGHSGGANTGSQFNADTGSNYSRRGSNNGGSDGTDINFPDMEAGGTSTEPHFQVAYASNLAGKEKLMQSWLIAQTGAGAGNAPFRNETVGKWANTSNAVSSYQWITSASATFNSGSEVVVLGWDPADTHTDNFWEELVDTSWSSGSSVETSAFATKKYLWYQGWFKTGGSMSGSYSALQVGSGGTISTSGYTERYSINGANDATEINKSNMYGLVGQGNDGSGNELTYINGFIINNSANEKLIISNSAGFDSTTGSGSGSEPRRTKGIGKWVTTGSQINKMKILSAAGSGAWVGGQLKVWGSD